MMQENEWQQLAYRLPIIATFIVRNDESTILECLESSCRHFDASLIFLENSTDGSAAEIDKYIRRKRPKNVFVFDLSTVDPWVDYRTSDALETLSKAQFKCLDMARKLASDGVWLAADPRVSLPEDARRIVQSSVAKWKHPNMGFSFFKAEELEAIPDLFLAACRLQSPLFPGPKSVGDRPCFYCMGEQKMTMLESAEPLQTIGKKINKEVKR